MWRIQAPGPISGFPFLAIEQSSAKSSAICTAAWVDTSRLKLPNAQPLAKASG
jgi:hypothetical protein